MLSSGLICGLNVKRNVVDFIFIDVFLLVSVDILVSMPYAGVFALSCLTYV